MYDIKLFKNLDLFCIKKKSLEYINYLENTLYPYLKILYFFLQLRLTLLGIVFFLKKIKYLLAEIVMTIFVLKMNIIPVNKNLAYSLKRLIFLLSSYLCQTAQFILLCFIFAFRISSLSTSTFINILLFFYSFLLFKLTLGIKMLFKYQRNQFNHE